jgi:hypothetical protein
MGAKRARRRIPCDFAPICVHTIVAVAGTEWTGESSMRQTQRHAARTLRRRNRDRLPEMAYQEGERAKKMENPLTRAPVENTAKRGAALAGRNKRSA